MSAPLVILGTGLAGWTLAREFRKLDADTPIVLVSRDDGAVYSKPMLSNAIAGRKTAAALATATAEAAAAPIGAAVLAGREARAIDPVACRLVLDDRTIEYGRLVLAQGAEPIRLALEGDGADAVLSVNDLVDYARFREAVEGRGHVTVLGAGLIGCEFANDLVAGGVAVELVDPAPLPLGRLAPEPVGVAMRDALAAAGVRLHSGTSARAVRRSGDGFVVELADGTAIATDVVLSAVGLRPRTALAAAAGLAVDRGIVVDRWLRTSVPDVYALGDCAQVDGQVMLYVMPLMTGARALARTLAGTPTEVAYPVMPIAVKTPVLPVTLVPPAAGLAGTWRFDAATEGVDGRFVDADGRLAGFALAGAATARRAALIKAIGSSVEA